MSKKKDTTTTELDIAAPPDTLAGSIFATGEAFDHAQRAAKLLAASDLVPKEFKGNVPNCVLALEMAARIGASPLPVMQNIYFVHNKPAWSSQFLISCINSCGKFSPLRYEETPTSCRAWAKELATDERLEGPEITMEMADGEGWTKKAGSKWQTMPALMLRYRAATFFARTYCPEITMGMRTAEEERDIRNVTPPPAPDEPRVALYDTIKEDKLDPAAVVAAAVASGAVKRPVAHLRDLTDEEAAYLLEERENWDLMLAANQEATA